MTQEKLSGDVYYPDEETVSMARVPDWHALAAEAEQDYQGFWEREAKELHWFAPWNKVLDDSDKPFYKWFVGAQTNIVYNCLDRHVEHLAAEQTGADLGRRKRARCARSPILPCAGKSASFANVLRSMGVQRATGSPSTWGVSRSCPLPCWPVPRSARSIRWCMADSPSKRCTTDRRQPVQGRHHLRRRLS